jgi:hypothetical protein
LKGIKIGLKILIKYLIDAQSYLEDEEIQSKLCKDNCTIVQINKTENESEYKCIEHQYKIRIVNRSPLIIYIENFLPQNVIKHLMELA